MNVAVLVAAALLVLGQTSGPALASSAHLPTSRMAAPSDPSPSAGAPTDPSGASGQVAGSAAPAGAAMTLDDAIALAMTANPSLLASRLKIDAASAAILTARERPNPELTLEEERETPRDALTLALPFETSGKRSRRVAVAEAEVRAAGADTDAAIADVRSQVRRAYAALAAERRRSEELDALAALAARTTGAARDRFESGAAPKLESLQAQLASAQADNEATTSHAEQTASRAELNALLAREPESPLETADGLDAGEVPSSEKAVAVALAGNVDIAAWDRKIEAALARADLARAGRHPDPVLAGTVTHRSQPDFDWGWRASFTVTLPVFTHHRGAVLTETRNVEQLRAEREATRVSVRGKIAAAVARASWLREQVLRFRDEILPQASEVETMAEDSYRSGQTGLVSMIQAVQSSRDARLRAVQAGLDYQLALDDLERAMGVPLPRRAEP